MIRLCHLDPTLAGCFQDDRFAEQFEIFADLEAAMQPERATNND
jgi:hypothetical protein